jgi:hypothetical protein
LVRALARWLAMSLQGGHSVGERTHQRTRVMEWGRWRVAHDLRTRRVAPAVRGRKPIGRPLSCEGGWSRGQRGNGVLSLHAGASVHVSEPRLCETVA